jgi:hypothetical protein
VLNLAIASAAPAAQQSKQELGGGEGTMRPVRPPRKLHRVAPNSAAPSGGGLRHFLALAAPACWSQQQQLHGRPESACATAASRRGAPAPCHSSAPLTPNVAKATTCAPHAAVPPLPRPLARLRPHRRQSCAALARRAGGAGAPRSRGARSISPPPESPHNGRCRHVGRAAASSHRRIGGRKAAHRRLTKSAGGQRTGRPGGRKLEHIAPRVPRAHRTKKAPQRRSAAGTTLRPTARPPKRPWRSGQTVFGYVTKSGGAEK